MHLYTLAFFNINYVSIYRHNSNYTTGCIVLDIAIMNIVLQAVYVADPSTITLPLLSVKEEDIRLVRRPRLDHNRRDLIKETIQLELGNITISYSRYIAI